MQGHVPVAADGVPALVLGDVDEFRVIGELLDHIDRSVVGVVVHHDDVVLEAGLLAERRFDGVADGAHAVLARDDDGSLILEAVVVEFDVLELRFQIAADGLQVCGAGLLHLDLDGTVLRIHVVEDLLAALAGIGLHVVIQELVDVLQRPFLGNLQAQVVHAGELVVHIHPFHGFLHGAAAVEEHRAEIKIVAQGTELAVDHRGVDALVAFLVEVVGIDHRSAGVLDERFHAFEREEHQAQRRVFGGNQGIGCAGIRSDGAHGRRAVEARYFEDLAAQHLFRRVFSDMEKINLIDKRLCFQVGDGLRHLRFFLERNETVDVLHKTTLI